MIFTSPAYNYTRDFPYLWDEIVLPIPYSANPASAEQILLTAARSHAITSDPAAQQALSSLEKHYALSDAFIEPSVYWRITDN